VIGTEAIAMNKKENETERERRNRKRRSYKDVKAVYIFSLKFTGTDPLARSEHVTVNHLRRTKKKEEKK
jgi:hypothetical protein